MRRSGQTTRLVDRWVQEFFDKGITYIYEGRGTRSQHEQTIHALKIFQKRMQSEHRSVGFEAKYGEYDRIMCYKVVKIELPAGV
jgi:hypothetical protein